MSIRAKILLAIILAVMLSIAGITVIVSVEMNKAFIKNFQAGSKAQLERMNAFVNTFFASASSNAELLARQPLVVDNIGAISSYLDKKEAHTPAGAELPFPERAIYEHMLEMTRVFPSYALVYISNNAGAITQAPDDVLSAGFNPSKRPWYLDAVSAGKTIITEAYISDSGGAVTTIATPILKGGSKSVIGVAAIDITLDTLTDETGKVSVGSTGYVLMLDSLNQVIADPKNSGYNIPEKDRWLGKVIDDLPEDAAKAMKMLSVLKEGYREVTFNGREWLASVQTTSDGWKMIMLQERAEVFADAMNVTLGILLVGGIIALLMLAVAWIVARSIVRPVDTLATASRAVADGNLQAIPHDESLFRGELGILHKSLKIMVSRLAELIDTANAKMQEAEAALSLSRDALKETQEAKQTAEKAKREGVLQTAQQLGGVIDQLSRAMGRLEKEAGRTGERTREQHDRVAVTAAAIMQMNAAVADVARSTSRTAELADKARSQAHNGKTLVLDVVGSMGEIEKQSLAMRESLSNLGSQAKDIGQIMGVINDIADQTNLLALNAAIEAARAGEAGRGFAVVADEVRKLAEKTMEATKQVGSAIRSIQSGTGENMSAMEQAAAFVSESTKVAARAGDALAQIESMVYNTAEEIRTIATASEEQSATLEAINQSTDGINSITAEVAESAKLSNEAVLELARLSEQLAAIVSELKKG